MTNNELFPIFSLSGTPYEIGLQHGQLCRKQIDYSIESYQRMFRENVNLSWDEAKQLSRHFIDIIRAYNADYLEEMRGVAEGAGLEFEDILALNCRSELGFVGDYLAEALREEGCTSIGVNSQAGLNGDAYLAQNWDWRIDQRKAVVRLNIKQANGKPSIHLITEAGIIGKMGYNSKGIGLTLNALSTDAAPRGVPLHIIMRSMLDSVSLRYATLEAVRSPIGCCANFMFGGGDHGEVADMEVENEDYDILYPQQGIIVHTNHFVSPRLPRYPRKDLGKFTSVTSPFRLGLADRLIREKAGAIDQKVIGDVLSTHYEFPAGICAHPDPYVEPSMRGGTVFSMIINLTQRRLWFAKGNPCENCYEEVDLSFFGTTGSRL